MAAMKSAKLYFEQQAKFFFIRNYNKTNPTIIRHHYIA